MVNGVSASPEVVGRERQQTAEHAQQSVCALGDEKRSVSAVMLNDEYPHQQTAGRNGERQGQPIRKLKRPIHQGAGADEKANRR